MDDLDPLLVAARDGDRLALAAFVRRTQPDVWRFCAHLLDQQSADDLTQEVYLRSVRSLPTYAGGSARAWLLTIARRAAADEIRRRQRRRSRLRTRGADPADTLDPDTAMVAATEDPAAHLVVSALVRDLEPDRRVAFVLTQVLGLSYAEAAEVIGVPIGTVRSRVARAREDLVAWLEDRAPGTAAG